MISLLVCSRISGNDNSALPAFLASLNNMSSSRENFEVLIKFDDDDDKVNELLPILNTHPFRIKHIIAPRGRGYIDLHLFYNMLLPLIDDRTTIIGAMADDFTIVRAGWDEFVLEKARKFKDQVFIIHGCPHPPVDRADYEKQKFCPTYDIDNMENLYIIDEAPLWGRRLIEACNGFGYVSFTDAWTLALEHNLFHNHSINRTIFLEEPIVHRKVRDDIDQAGGIRWQTDRANNFALMKTKGFHNFVGRQASLIAEMV